MAQTSGPTEKVRKMFLIGLSFLVFLAVTGCAVANRFYVPPAFEEAETVGEATIQSDVPNRISVLKVISFMILANRGGPCPVIWSSRT